MNRPSGPISLPYLPEFVRTRIDSSRFVVQELISLRRDSRDCVPSIYSKIHVRGPQSRPLVTVLGPPRPSRSVPRRVNGAFARQLRHAAVHATYPDSASCCTAVPAWRQHPSATTLATSHIACSQRETMRRQRAAGRVRRGHDRDRFTMDLSVPFSLASFSLSMLTTRSAGQSVGRSVHLRRLQARSSTTSVFTSDAHDPVSRHGFRDGAGGASGTGR